MRVRRIRGAKLRCLGVKTASNLWLTRPPSAEAPRTALVLLNTPPRPAAALRQLWALSSYRVCADAAANRLRDSIQLAIGEDEAMVSGQPAALRQRLLELQQVSRMHESMVPDAVTGDFDSIRQDVVDFYRERGCLIAHNASQNSTDFEKALRLVEVVQAAALRGSGQVDAAAALGPASVTGATAAMRTDITTTSADGVAVSGQTLQRRWAVVAFGASAATAC